MKPLPPSRGLWRPWQDPRGPEWRLGCGKHSGPRSRPLPKRSWMPGAVPLSAVAGVITGRLHDALRCNPCAGPAFLRTRKMRSKGSTLACWLWRVPGTHRRSRCVDAPRCPLPSRHREVQGAQQLATLSQHEDATFAERGRRGQCVGGRKGCKQKTGQRHGARAWVAEERSRGRRRGLGAVTGEGWRRG